MKPIGWVVLMAGLSALPGWAAVFVFPRADCVVVNRGGLWQNLWNSYDDPPAYAQFGYVAFIATDQTVPLGSNNIFVQDPQFRNQPATFHTGFHTNVFGTYFDPSIGLSWFLNGGFATADPSLPACPGMSAGGVPLPAQFAPLGLASGQTVRLSVTPTTGSSSCAATLSFADAGGNPIGSSAVVNPAAGRVSFIELVGSAHTTPGHRVLVQPVFTTSAPDSCQASVEVYASATGVTAATTRPIQPLYQYSFDPQSLSAGQTLRVNIAASASQSCGAAIHFTDASGNPLGNTLTQTLAAGTAAYLDLPSTSVPGLTGWSGGHVTVFPKADVSPARNGNTIGTLSNGFLVSETCFASAEIFDTLTGYTRSVVNPQPLH